MDVLASFVEILFVLLVLLAELIKLEDSVQRTCLLLFVAAAIRTIVIVFAANCRLFELILPLRLPNFILNLSECVTGLQLRYESLRAFFSRIHKAAAFLGHIGCRDALVDQFELKRPDIFLDLLHLPGHLRRGTHNFLWNYLRLRLDG